MLSGKIPQGYNMNVQEEKPAIIFAVRRTFNVPGRIRLLIVSIITINIPEAVHSFIHSFICIL